MELRDLIYFDFEKASSLFSQLERGLIREIQAGREESTDERNIRSYDLKLFKPEFGGIATEKKSQLETRVIHHDLLDRIETALFSQGFAVDLNSGLGEEMNTPEMVRAAISTYPCVRVEGWAEIEDYERFVRIAESFNPVLQFIAQCGRNSIEGSDEFKGLKATIEEMKAVAKSERDRNKRAAALSRVKELEVDVETLVTSTSYAGHIPQWLVEGIRLFVDTFMTNRITLRVYPFADVPEFGVLANLKRSSFTDSEIDNILFAYGPRPNLRLSILGLVTSVPAEAGHPLDEIRTAQKAAAADSDEQGFEEGFRNAFEGVEGLERFVRFSRYPNITVYPIAVFRNLRPVQHLETIPQKSVRSRPRKRSKGRSSD